MRPTIVISCAVVALAALLAACTPQRPEPQTMAAAEPVTLSFPYRNLARNKFPGHRELAERVKASYVRVTIYDKGDGRSPVDIEAQTLVHASGIIVDERGYLLTAAHIAKNTSLGARITTVDGRNYQANILRVDPMRELALLRMTAPPQLQPAVFGHSASLRRGEPALAIGSPRFKTGIVSLGYIRIPKRKTRLQYGSYGFDSGIEIKMEVESGHSGGPAFNANGELIGMVASYSLGDTTKEKYVSPAITFVVPVDDLRTYVDENIR